MPATPASSLLEAYDSGRLTPRFWVSMGLVALQGTFDYFDFFVVGYLVALLAPVWHLSYGQSSVILIGSGFGSVIGALLFGRIADRFGRKPALIAGTLLISLASAGVALVPDGAWIGFALLRTLIGIGLGGAAGVQTTIAVELTPTRHRTFISGLMMAPTSLGIILAAVLSSQLLPIIGWRGLAAIGTAPGLIGLLLIWAMPESPRWLLSRGRFQDARRAAAKQLGVAPDSLPLPISAPGRAPPANVWELLANKRAFWLIAITSLAMSTTTYGYQLWAPTILSLALHLPVGQVAGYFTYIGISGFLGRFVFSYLPTRIGRRRTGQVVAAGSAVFILLAGLYYNDSYGPVPAFVAWLTLAAVFVNGGFSNSLPYAPECYPVHLGGSASALAQATNGLGKMLGPLCLGVIAGSGNVVNPMASEAAVIPAFAFLSGCCVAAGLAYTFLPIETHGVPLAIADGAAAPNGPRLAAAHHR